MTKEAVDAVLKPCPWCACGFFKKKLELFAAPTDGSGDKVFQYKCPKCRAWFSITAKTEQEAIDKWNTRIVQQDEQTTELPERERESGNRSGYSDYMNGQGKNYEQRS